MTEIDTIACERCDEQIEEQWCTHGRDLCPECIDWCRDCQTEREDERAYDADRDDR